MEGDFRDPMVGRDILIGGFLGLLHALAIVVPILIYRSFNGSLAPSSGWSTDTLMGLRGAVSQLAWQFGSSVLFMSFLFLIVVIVALAFRRRWVAIGVVWTVLFIILGLVSYYRSPWFLWIGLALLVTIITVTVTRFGMLAYCSQAVFYGIAWFWPLTTDTTSWYFGVTVFAGLVILVLSAFGFYTSLAGQPIFGQRFSGEGVVGRQV